MRGTFRSLLACVVKGQRVAAVDAAAGSPSLAWPLEILRQAMITGSSTAKPLRFGCCLDSMTAAVAVVVAAAAEVEVDCYNRSTAGD